MEQFVNRHLGIADDEMDEILKVIGVDSVETLLDQTIPSSVPRIDDLDLPEGLTEAETQAELRGMMKQNVTATPLIGLGFHRSVMPPVIKRNVWESPAWYTAYTPYQPEISQGRLEVLLNFQTMVSDLCGLEIANASLLDEASAASEAMAMAHRIDKTDRNVFVIDAGCHPHTIGAVTTRARAVGIDVVVDDPATADTDDVFGVMLSQPRTDGSLTDIGSMIGRWDDAITTCVVDLLSLTLIEPPGKQGVDIVVGVAQRFGLPMGFGGPHPGFIACNEENVRSLPGRLVGVSRDTSGRMGLRLALQTREQHIRRQRATSNVCTAQVLPAVVSALYACWHGPDGLRWIARTITDSAAELHKSLTDAGIEIRTSTWFDTVTFASDDPDAIMARAHEAGLRLRKFDDSHVSVSFDETSGPDVVAAVLEVLDLEPTDGEVGDGIPVELRRSSEFLTHEVFTRYRTEHEMLRYLRRLSDRDLALDRTMIPLGSCTMKLNPTTAMESISWPEIGDIHPYAPLSDAAGYLELFDRLEKTLVGITGYDRVSLQPNAGSQGELAGLLAIAAYHESRNDTDRRLCLIPASAHGTNAASAVMAGMVVKVINTDDGGNVDLDHLKEVLSESGDQVAGIMVTYPSTHGVFEDSIVEVCDLIHAAGGQVYVDGANLNAMLGLARPGDFGADVSHLNLHKTFAIPHGGGGPGVGPIAVKEHLAPFLPNHPTVAAAGPESGVGNLTAAPWGSAGILSISWTFIRMLGATGLKRSGIGAILAANYVVSRVGGHFPVLYTSQEGRVAHECILDLRGITKETGVTAEDVAKRLTDHGIHAPTLSFPVVGTLMVEPTESESIEELDRFCDALISIREEIRRVAAGEWPEDDNPLRNSPHPAEDLLVGDWAHPYSREVAAYPGGNVSDKYWPPVSRIDAASGDRNLVCACPPLDQYR
ncbi:MAG: aminomethyl-transferring glycine dehydrogenase [Acidimicrobiia bacterium]|nr:aminomethyl-transferring glycine dehydrogenase [Acidimicrobiia bacterium]